MLDYNRKPIRRLKRNERLMIYRRHEGIYYEVETLDGTTGIIHRGNLGSLNAEFPLLQLSNDLERQGINPCREPFFKKIDLEPMKKKKHPTK